MLFHVFFMTLIIVAASSSLIRLWPVKRRFALTQSFNSRRLMMRLDGTRKLFNFFLLAVRFRDGVSFW